MHRIKLSATESTNSYLKELMAATRMVDFTVVTTVLQRRGRGQVDATWESEPGKNLTFSVLKLHERLGLESHFLISICVSLALYQVLSLLGVPRLSIKWPNDILSGNAKICGILIENSVSGQEIKSSVIGIGLNVNQTSFPNLSGASSLKLVLDRELHLEELLDTLLQQLKISLSQLQKPNGQLLLANYEQLLFKKGSPATFREPNGPFFNGIIQGVTKQGKLRVLSDGGENREYGLKEVQLQY